MDFIINLLNKLLFLEKEPQKIGLSQLKKVTKEKKTTPSLKNKDVKLSDLMRRVS